MKDAQTTLVKIVDWEGLVARAKTIRKHIIQMTALAGSGHPGGSLSATDILTVLYFQVMRYDPQNPTWPDRDRFILSKGHASSLLYAVLAEAGYFPRELLAKYRKLDSTLEGHPDMRRVPGVEASTGSLGQGLSIAIGHALAGKLDHKDFRVYALLSDGENDEGQTWEAAMSAAHYKLDNLTAFLDYNKFQLDGAVSKIMNLEPLRAKWHAFGWETTEIVGHNLKEILEALERAPTIKGKPYMIIAHTVKGKGVSFMENNNEFHGVAPTLEQAKVALEELEQ